MHEKLCGGTFAILLWMMIPMGIAAQNPVIENGMHGGELSIGLIDHSYVGSESRVGDYEYQGVGFGLSYIGRQMRASLLYGRSSEPRTFVDVSAIGWFAPSFTRREKKSTRFSAPMGLMVAWKRMTAEKNVAPLGASAILFGAGGEMIHSLNPRVRVRLRAIPLVGITGSRIADAVGFSWAVDAEARVFIAEGFFEVRPYSRLCLPLSTLEYQRLESFLEAVDEVYDYASRGHIFSAGVWF